MKHIVIGRYAFGSGSDEFFDVAKNRQGALTIKREGGTERPLFHIGPRVFHPAGADAVRIQFDEDSSRIVGLTILLFWQNSIYVVQRNIATISVSFATKTRRF